MEQQQKQLTTKAILPWACHLVMKVELACLGDLSSYVDGDLVPDGLVEAGHIRQPLVLQGWGWAQG